MACKYCFNANTDSELTPENDLHYIALGVGEKGYSVYFKTGDGRPTEILFEDRKNLKTSTGLAACYIPKYCPECGRELTENRKWLEAEGAQNENPD